MQDKNKKTAPVSKTDAASRNNADKAQKQDKFVFNHIQGKNRITLIADSGDKHILKWHVVNNMTLFTLDLTEPYSLDCVILTLFEGRPAEWYIMTQIKILRTVFAQISESNLPAQNGGIFKPFNTKAGSDE